MARYRKVEVKTWSDREFRLLSPIPPCGQGLWLWLLTGPRTTNIPGVLVGTDHVMASELRWSVEAFREAFTEVFREGLALGDWDAGLVWLPGAARPGDKRNRPESPNVVRSWRDTWDEVPECVLKIEIYQQLKAFAEAFGEPFAKAFREALRKPSPKAKANQEQDLRELRRREEPDLDPRSELNQESDKYTRNARAHPSAGVAVNGGHGPVPVLGDAERRGRLLRLKRCYPAGVYREADWALAERELNRAEDEGDDFEAIAAGMERYRTQCDAKGSTGSQFVMSPLKFVRERAYREAFPVPEPRAAARKSFADYERESAARLATLPGDDPGPM